VDDDKYKHSWEILASQKSFVVYADSAQEKREWLHDLQLALDEACVVLQCVAVCCSVSQCVAVRMQIARKKSGSSFTICCLREMRHVLQCIVICCRVLQCVSVCFQCVAVCCGVLQCVCRYRTRKAGIASRLAARSR